jgi:iron donor protein CyaY
MLRKCWYTGSMLDEIIFRRHADSALESLKKALILAESDADFEVEEQNGVLIVSFEEPPSKFVLTPNAPVRQIWISALSTSFKLDWDDATHSFVFPKTGESLKPLVARLITEHLGSGQVVLS